MLTYTSDLQFWISLWIIFAIATVWNAWKKSYLTCGLPLLYLFHLSMNHFFGALVYIFPWYSRPFEDLTYLGFIQSVYGVIGFFFGSVVLATPLIKVFVNPVLKYSAIEPHANLPQVYLVTGLFIYLILAPQLQGIPSVRTVANAGSCLTLVALCLGCWKGWITRRKGSLWMWVFFAFFIPVFSMATMGFLGYGVTALSVVLFFLFTFYRPRWQLVLGSVCALYFGLSFYVAYMENRSDLREKLWYGGEGSLAALNVVMNMGHNFKLLNILDENQLWLIDARLNQNVLVGKAVEFIGDGNSEFAKGETLKDAALAMVPRIFWSNKPVMAGSGDYVTRYAGVEVGDETSIGIGQVMEFYVNFGTRSVVLGFLILGILIRVFDAIGAHHLRRGDWQGFMFWFIPGLGFINSGGSLVEVTATVLASFVFCILIRRFVLPRFSGKKISFVQPPSGSS